MIKKVPLFILVAIALMLWSCASTPEDNANKVVNAVNEYCENIEKAIADELIDDADVEMIKGSEKNYMDLIAEITESYAGNANEKAEFQQKMYASEAWLRMADVNGKLANTEGYIKLSLTNK